MLSEFHSNTKLLFFFPSSHNNVYVCYCCFVYWANGLYYYNKYMYMYLVLEIWTGKNLSIKKTKGNNSKTKQARVTVHMHCTPP